MRTGDRDIKAGRAFRNGFSQTRKDNFRNLIICTQERKTATETADRHVLEHFEVYSVFKSPLQFVKKESKFVYQFPAVNATGNIYKRVDAMAFIAISFKYYTIKSL